MQITTGHLSVEVPTGMFDGHNVVRQRIVAWSQGERPGMVPPILELLLSEVSDLDEDVPPGPPLAERLRTWMGEHFDAGETLTEEEVLVAGARGPAWVVEWDAAEGDPGAPDGGAQFKLIAKVPLDGRAMVEFSAWGTAAARPVLEPAFREMLASVAVTGDVHGALDAQRAHEEQLLARLDALTERAEAMAAGVTAAGSTDGAEGDLAGEPPAPPAGGATRAVAGGHTFQVTGARWQAAVHGGGLLVQVELTADAPAEALGSRLLRGRNGEGGVALELSLERVAEAGPVPTAAVVFRHGRTDAQGARLRMDGFDHPLDFSGHAVLVEGWVLLSGELGVSYDRSRREPLELAVPLDPRDIDWSRYRFTSLEEVQAADPAAVRDISIKDYPLEVIDPAILACETLERFHVYRHGWNEQPSLALPPELFRMPRLQRVFTHRFDVSELPEEAAAAPSLVDLGITEGTLTEVPEGLFRNPRLRKLDLRGNRLTSLPDDVHLPMLESLDLSGNRLTRLPDALLEQPSLSRLHLSGNPWEALPAAALPLAKDLSVAERCRHFDHRYPGADGRGTVEWDDAAYRAESRPELVGPLEAALAGEELGGHGDALRSMLRLAVGFVDPSPETYESLGNHRFGGFPDLPEGLEHPRFSAGAEGAPEAGYAYEFIAQLDLADLAPHQDYLPRSGVLFFFLKTIHEVYGEGSDAALVIHRDVDRSSLRSGAGSALGEDDYYEMTGRCYAPLLYRARPFASVPHLYGHRSNPHLFRGRAEALGADEAFLRDASLDALHDAERAACPRDHDVGAFGFTQNEDAESQAALARLGDPADWVILLRVGSAGDFCWGDAGDLFFVIHKSDLARGDFSAVHCCMESS